MAQPAIAHYYSDSSAVHFQHFAQQSSHAVASGTAHAIIHSRRQRRRRDCFSERWPGSACICLFSVLALTLAFAGLAAVGSHFLPSTSTTASTASEDASLLSSTSAVSNHEILIRDIILPFIFKRRIADIYSNRDLGSIDPPLHFIAPTLAIHVTPGGTKHQVRKILNRSLLLCLWVSYVPHHALIWSEGIGYGIRRTVHM